MTGSATAREDPFDTILAAHLEAEERGQAPSRAELLRRHPELAAALADALDALADVAARARDLADVGDPTAAGGEASDAPTLLAPGRLAKAGERIRYFGDYELIEELGRGGMGVVYRARQVTLNRHVALKMILSGAFASREEVLRFRREAEAAAALAHEGVVPIYEVGEHDGRCYYTMPFITGGTLAGRIAKLVGDERGSARLLAEVARAADHGHRHGIIHRDLKPQNILLDAEGRPLIADFGLARWIDAGDSLTGGRAIGTAAYMAPEQAADDRGAVTTASDVWSLGVILYQLLTGESPFQRASPIETLHRVLDVDPAPPSQRRPGLSRDIETICLKCLEKDPARRYASAAALADDLDRFVRGEPVEARPVGAWARAWKWCRRHPARASLLAVSATALMVVLVGGAIFLRRERHLREVADASGRRAVAERDEANHQRRKAEAALTRARALGLAAAANAEQGRGRATTALLLAREAVRTLEAPESLRSLREALAPTALAGPSLQADAAGSYDSAAFTADSGLFLVYGAALDPRRLRLLSGDPTPRLFDRHGRAVAAFPDEPSAPRTRRFPLAAVSSDGRRVVVLSNAGVVRVFAADGALTHTFAPDAASGPARSFAMTPDGRRLAIAWERAAALWSFDAGALREVRLRLDAAPGFEGAPLRAVAASPDGERIVVLAGGRAGLWAGDGSLVADLAWIDRNLSLAAFSADGRRLCLAGSARRARARSREGASTSAGATSPLPEGPVVHVLDRDGRLVDVLCGRRSEPAAPETDRGSDRVVGLAIAPDGELVLAGASDATARLLPVRGEERAVLTGFAGPVTTVAFSADGALLLAFATAPDDGEARIRLWDRDGRLRHELRDPDGPVRGAALSPDGRSVLSLLQLWAAPRVWHLEDVARSTLAGPAIPVRDLHYDARGVTACWEDGSVRRLDADGAREVFGPSEPRALGAAWLADDRVVVFHAAPGGHVRCSWVAVKKPDGYEEVGMWGPTPPSPELVESGSTVLTGHRDDVLAAAATADGETLVTGSRDGTARIWDRRGVEVALLAHPAPVRRLALAPQGDELSTLADDGVVRLWGLDGARRAQLAADAVPAHAAPALVEYADARYMPDGSRVVAIAADGQVRLWGRDGALRGVLAPPRAWRPAPASLAIAPDGSRIAVARWGDQVDIFDGTGAHIAALGACPARVRDLFVAPGAREVVAVGGDGSAWVYRSGEAPRAIAAPGPIREAWPGAAPDRIVARTGNAVYTLRLEGGEPLEGRPGAEVEAVARSASGEERVEFLRQRRPGTDARYRIDKVRGAASATGRASTPLSRTFEAHLFPSSEGSWLATTEASVAWIRDPGGRIAVRFQDPDGRSVKVIHIDAGGRRAIVVAGDTLLVVPFSGDARPIARIERGPRWGPLAEAVKVHPRGDRILVRHLGTIRLLDLEGREVARVEPGTPSARQPTAARMAASTPLLAYWPAARIALAHDRIFAVCGDGAVRGWNLRGEEVVALAPADERAGSRAVFASPDGTWLGTAQSALDASGRSEFAIAVYRAPDRPVANVALPSLLRGGVLWAAFAPDGRLAVANGDGSVHIWQAGHGLVTLRSHDGAAYDLRFSPDGTKLASVGVEGIVRVHVANTAGLLREADARLWRDLDADEAERYQDLLLHAGAQTRPPR